MGQGSSRVREVRAHLRTAAALLGEGRCDEALHEVDAALAIDPGSLPAQALRERVKASQSEAAQHTAAWNAGETSPDGKPDAFGPGPDVPADHGRFVPPGINAQSWIGFEQRILERRFRALLATVQAAAARGDGVAARVAFEEARELRPDAPELEALSDSVLRLPIAAAAPPDGFLYSRAAGAVLLLLVGVSLLIGIERLDTEGPGVFLQDGAPALATPEQPPDTLPPPIALAPVAPEIEITPVRDTPTGTTGRDTVEAEVLQAQEREPAVRAAAAATSSVNDARSAVAERVTRPVQPQPEATAAPRASTASAEVTRAPQVPAPRDLPARAADTTTSGRSSAPAREAVVASAPPRETRDTVVASSLPASRAEVTAPVVRAAPADAEVLAGASGRELPAVVEASAAATAIVRPENAVARVLDQYANRFNQLDASGVREVWPSAPERDLARAFEQLESQAISFDTCDIDVDERERRAVASCHGSQSYVGRIGSRERRTESRRWEFDLRSDGDAWRIENLQTR